MSWYSLSVRPMEEYTSAVIAGILRSISTVALTALVLFATGCGSRFGWQGTWEGDRGIKPLPGENPGIAATLGRVFLIIEGSEFKLKEVGIPYTGTIRYEGEKAFLKIETKMGTPITKEPIEVQNQMKEIELTSRADGKIDFYDPGNDSFPEPVTLERKAEKPKT